MNGKQGSLRRWDGMIGFSLVAVLLNMLVCANPAAAQCGSGGPSGANTACGTGALANNTTGYNDSAFGVDALQSNTTGYYNTASGVDALQSNTTGYYNTASGYLALANNTTGNFNTANGDFALYNNTAGNDNTANGDYALYDNNTDKSNIGLSYNAGNNIVAGSNNIDIGGSGPGDESNTIRIGNNTQSATFIAGISATGVTSSTVEVTSSGQLGVLLSSARYKRDIHDMGGASAGLMKLRPVIFRYKDDPHGVRQYGLIAEEVVRVYPELVSYGSDGKVVSVHYLNLVAMLLNQLQQQTKQIAALNRQVKTLTSQMATQRAGLE
jgi:trimeric autotransporter adhesin